MKKFKHLVFAGTFDRLHIGHKKLLDCAFKMAEKVSIGITTDEMVRIKLLNQTIERLGVRRYELGEYLKRKGYLNRAKIFILHDIYGPAIVDETMDAILVTKLTKKNAEKINEIRVKGYGLGVKKKLKPLKIILAGLVRGDDKEIVTSERIRMGEIDREGQGYQLSVFSSQKKQLILPNYLRKELRKPLGKVISGSESQIEKTAKKVYRYIDITICPMVITVGDIVTISMLKIGFNPDVKIIDLRSRRENIEINGSLEILSRLNSLSFRTNVYSKSAKKNKARFLPPQDQLKQQVSKNFSSPNYYINKQGTINIKTAQIINSAIGNFIRKKKKKLIIVKGEEDLLALPAILFAPLQGVVLYGQIDLGVVMVEVTEEKKREIEEILKKFN